MHFALSASNTIGVEGFLTLYCRWPCLALFVTPKLRTFSMAAIFLSTVAGLRDGWAFVSAVALFVLMRAKAISYL